MTLLETEGIMAQMDHPGRLSPLTLAFMGDAVFELMARTLWLRRAILRRKSFTGGLPVW